MKNCISRPHFIARLLVFGLVALVILNACGPSKPKMISVDPKFSRYVSGYTSGMISRKSTIRVQLADELPEGFGKKRKTAGELPDSTLLESIFSIEPHVEGKAVWINSSLIEFVPKDTLPSNQLFTVYFDLEKVAYVEKGYEKFGFQFGTFTQKIDVHFEGMQHLSEYAVDFMTLKGEIKTTDIVNKSDLKKCIWGEMNGKKYTVKLNKSWGENSFRFTIDSLERTTLEQKIKILWNGESIQSISKGSFEETIPALGDFDVTNIDVKDEEDQRIDIYFSEPIHPSQNLNGIITLENEPTLNYQVAGNCVSIFLSNRIIGERKLTVSAGIQNFRGHKKMTAYTDELTFLEPKPMVRIKGNGSILPNSQGLIFPFETVSLKAVDVRIIKIYEKNIHHFLQINNLDGEDALHRFGNVVAEKTFKFEGISTENLKKWNKHVIDLSKLIKPDRGSIYRVSIKFQKEYALCDCPLEDTPIQENEDYYGEAYRKMTVDEEKWSERKWDNYGWNDAYETWYYYSDSESPCENRYYRGKAVSRNILASDLGVIVKLEEKKLAHVFVNDMLTTNPVSNASVSFYDFAKKVIVNGKTDSNGMLSAQLTEKPFLVLVQRGEQNGYLKLGDAYSNSLSKFDISGETIQHGVKGFVYAERGVWRPGDSMYVNFILENNELAFPKNHPVQFELMDPDGNTIYEKTRTTSINGTYDFRCATRSNARTGNYLAQVTVGNRTYKKSLKVETIKPNRLKIEWNEFPKSNENNTGKFKATWLHGAKANGLKSSIQVQISQTKTYFEHFKNYDFDSPIRSFQADVQTVFDGKLDEQGIANFEYNAQLRKDVPGKLKANYITKVFEPGGDFSIDRTQVDLSPFKTYVGIKAPASLSLDQTLETDKKHRFEVVTVDENGKLKSTGKLRVQIYKLQTRWWMENGESDFPTYFSRTGTILFSDQWIETKNGQGTIDVAFNYPEFGSFVVLVTDPTGNHQTGKLIDVDWPYWNRATRTNSDQATMLQFSTNKESYVKGESIEISFPAPSQGRALISVETRSKVIKKYWITTQKGLTKHTFTATADMAPNAFIHITLLQPHAQTTNDLPIRLYGVVPVTVDDPATHLHPVISCEKSFKPESKASITVHENSGKKMNYTLAIVDDGLLDLTRFKTPQPWNTFYAKEALGIRTWDMYDYVIGAYAGKFSKLLSIGGDGEEMNGKNPKANRFKPMVVFLGPFTVEAGQKKIHSISIPNYVGSVRVMVVAQHNGAYGNAEKTVAVKKPLMILPTVPRVLSPEETISIPLHVFAIETQVKQVQIECITEGVLPTQKSVQTLNFDDIGDKLAFLQLKTGNRLGIGKLKFRAKSGSISSTAEIEIDVRAPNPLVTTSEKVIVKPGESWTKTVQFDGYLGSNRGTIEISTIPAIALTKRMDYLIQYPHGCVEQTTSAAFPQVYLAKLTKLTKEQELKTTKNVERAIQRLTQFQTYDGGFAYWPGGSESDNWGSSYAGHFLIEAEAVGYQIPSAMKSKWINYQKKQAQKWSLSNSSYFHNRHKETHQITQAYRLYVLALAKSPELAAMNRLKEEPNLSNESAWRLAAAYWLVGQKEIAKNMVKNRSIDVKSYSELSYSYGSDFRDESMILETLSLLKDNKRAMKLVDKVASKLSSKEWLSTQESAYGLLAIASYAGLKQTDKMKANYLVKNQVKRTIASSQKIERIEISENENGSTVKLVNTGDNPIYLTWNKMEIPKISKEQKVAQDLKISTVFKSKTGEKIAIDKLKQGTDFTFEITVKNPGNKGVYKELALSQLVPSGWEIHNDRMDNWSSSAEIDFQDVRDDRVLTYFDLAPNASKTITIRLNATYVGKFYLPGTHAEAMYDHQIQAIVPGKWIEVYP